MIDTTIIQTQVCRYKAHCQERHCRPTYKGMAALLGISGRTVANVVQGSYNGRKYTDKPHASRCIGNDDFEIVRGLWGKVATDTFTHKKE